MLKQQKKRDSREQSRGSSDLSGQSTRPSQNALRYYVICYVTPSKYKLRHTKINIFSVEQKVAKIKQQIKKTHVSSPAARQICQGSRPGRHKTALRYLLCYTK